MPLFEYQCRDCGNVFEVLLRSAADRPGKCPQCGAARLEKKFAAFNPASGGVTHERACPSGGACPAPSACSGGSCPFGSGTG